VFHHTRRSTGEILSSITVSIGVRTVSVGEEGSIADLIDRCDRAALSSPSEPDATGVGEPEYETLERIASGRGR